MGTRVELPSVGSALGIRVSGYIDEGGFARVFKARHSRTGLHLAIKQLISTDARSPDVLCKESHIQRNLDHPFIVHCYGVINEEGVYTVVCDHVPGKSLLSVVNEKHGLSEALARKFTVQLLCALRYLHDDKCIAHRDIKLDNVLVEKEFIRLIDFGYSRSLDSEMETRCGSVPYAAPELLRGMKYTQAVDVWSFGVVVYAMLAGHLPFSGNTAELVDRICRQAPAALGRKVSPGALDFVTRLLTKDPRHRLTIAQAIDHPFVRAAENHWLLKEAVLDRPEFRCIRSDAYLDPKIVGWLVEHGYNREAIRFNPGDEIRDEASLAYEMLKVASIRANLTQLVMNHAAAESMRTAALRQAATISFKPLDEGALQRPVKSPKPSGRRAAVQTPARGREPGERVEIAHAAGDAIGRSRTPH